MLRATFKFLSSLKLALLLLSVLIFACICGTLCESGFNADVAKTFVYNAWWFNLWLVFLVINLFCVAAIRYPWKPHQTGFVITHAGIILLLIGGLIDRRWGVEGFMGLYRGQPATERMHLREQDLLVFAEGNAAPARTPFQTTVLGNATLPLKAKSPIPGLNVRILEAGTIEQSLQVALHAPLMGGTHEIWLHLDDSFDLGPATVSLVRGQLPEHVPAVAEIAPSGKRTPRLERHFQFSKFPDQVNPVTVAGAATGAKSELVLDAARANPVLRLALLGKKVEIQILQNLNQEYPLEGLPEWKLVLLGYYPNFRMVGKKPGTLDDKPENPAVVFELRGPPVEANDVAQLPEGHVPHGTPAPAFGDSSANTLSFHLGADGILRYQVKSRKKGASSGVVEAGKAVGVPWAKEATFTADWAAIAGAPQLGWRTIPPTREGQDGRQRNGLKCEVAAADERKEFWLAQSSLEELSKQAVEVGGQKVALAFADQAMTLPFRVELLSFHAPNQEGLQGSSAYMAFESTLRFADENGSHEAKIHMNHPATYPVTWYGPWLGTSYKFSQAGHDMPRNPDYSGVQILRDPGWMPKWVGCLMVSLGIFTMFYLKPYFKRLPESRRQADAATAEIKSGVAPTSRAKAEVLIKD